MLDSGSLYLLEPGFDPKDPSGNPRAGTLSNILYTEMEALRISSENLRPIMAQFAKVQAYAQQEDPGSGGPSSGPTAQTHPLEEQAPQLPGSTPATPAPAFAPTPIPWRQAVRRLFNPLPHRCPPRPEPLLPKATPRLGTMGRNPSKNHLPPPVHHPAHPRPARRRPLKSLDTAAGALADGEPPRPGSSEFQIAKKATAHLQLISSSSERQSMFRLNHDNHRSRARVSCRLEGRVGIDVIKAAPNSDSDGRR